MVHNGASIDPEDGIPIIISDNMKYTVTSPTGKKQVWEVITSPVAPVECPSQILDESETAKIVANVINKKGVTYKWYHNGRIIENVTTPEIFIKNPKDNKSHKIYAIAENQAGKLKCACTTVQWKKDVKTNIFDNLKIKFAFNLNNARSFSSYYGVYGASNCAHSDYNDLNSEDEDIYVVNDGNYEQDFKMYQVVDISEEFTVKEEATENLNLDCKNGSTGSTDVDISDKLENSEDVDGKNKQEETETEENGETQSFDSDLLKLDENFNIFDESSNRQDSLVAEIPEDSEILESEELPETEKSEKIEENSECSSTKDEINYDDLESESSEITPDIE